MSPSRLALMFMLAPVSFLAAQQIPRARVKPLELQCAELMRSKQPDAYQAATNQLATAKDRIPNFYLEAVGTAFDRPWETMDRVERSGLALYEAADLGPRGLETMLIEMLKVQGTTAVPETVPPLKQAPGDLALHLKRITEIFDQARSQQRQGIVLLSPTHRVFMFSNRTNLIEKFTAQIAYSEPDRPMLYNDRIFFGNGKIRYNWTKLMTGARHLLRLGETAYLRNLRLSLAVAEPTAVEVPGVKGDLLFAKETPHGWILFGGAGANTYDLDLPVAFLADLGGDDVYTGRIASSWDPTRANSVVVDFEGDDRYQPDPLGLATGTIGLGMLIDIEGDDRYELQAGSGGVGMGGLGILRDLAGNDTYAGSTYCLGAGFAGLGLLFDAEGNDTYTSHGFSLGLGGPAGVGVVFDGAGDDSYQCGGKIPSGYNRSDAPQAEPGDPDFQWTAMGMGMGVGRRILSPSLAHHEFALAGGAGFLLDADGDDRYESSNFSQACGYYFGLGVKMDFRGKDHHAGARYGHGAGAHYGIGLFADYQGEDTYRSSGPTYNGGCAWDHSVFLFLDAMGNDVYELAASSGPARADIGSWSVCADLGGDDRYRLKSRPARCSKSSTSLFYDHAGTDQYKDAVGTPFEGFGDGTSKAEGGGLFFDR